MPLQKILVGISHNSFPGIGYISSYGKKLNLYQSIIPAMDQEKVYIS